MEQKIEGVPLEKAKYFPTPCESVFKVQLESEDGKLWMGNNGLCVIASVENHNGTEWLHVSFSRKSRIPDYKDIQLIKKHFFGEDKKAIMIFPEKEHYINIHPFCLHLFYSEDNPLPNFDYMGSL